MVIDDIEVRFDCPRCGESMTVNEPMQEALIANGCVICGASVTDEAFADTTSNASTSG